MAISTKEAVYKFKLSYDKLDSQDYPKMQLPQILIKLNEAQNSVVRNYFTINNLLKTGVQGDSLRLDEFSPITILNNPYITNIQTGLEKNQYFIETKDLLFPYLHYLRGTALCSEDNCTEIEASFIEYTLNDIDIALNNENNSPSLLWGEIPLLRANERFYFYTDGKFKVDKVKIDYLRKPIEFDLPGYIKFDGTQSITSDSNLPDYFVEDIIREAVSMAKANLGAEDYQVAKSETISNTI